MARRRLISVIDKMIISDLMKTLASVLSVIVIIIVSRRFIKILAKAIEGDISGQTIMGILSLKIIIAMIALLPVSVFISVIMVLGRMYRDQEMSAISSAGGGVFSLYRAVFILMVPLSLLTMELSWETAPWAEAKIQTMVHEDQQTADIRGITAGRFSEYQHGELVFYVEEISADNIMKNVFVQNRKQGKLGVINSETAVIKDLPGGRYIVFENGERIQGEPGQVDFIIENFAEYAVRVFEKKTLVNLDRESIASERLLQTAVLVDIAELQRRISIPLSVLVLSALAIPLAQVSPRGGIYGNLFTAFLIYFCYTNMSKVSHSWVVKEVVPYWFGYIGVYFVTLVVVLLLLLRLYGKKWVAMKLNGMVPQ